MPQSLVAVVVRTLLQATLVYPNLEAVKRGLRVVPERQLTGFPAVGQSAGSSRLFGSIDLIPPRLCIGPVCKRLLPRSQFLGPSGNAAFSGTGRPNAGVARQTLHRWLARYEAKPRVWTGWRIGRIGRCAVRVR